MSKATSSTRSVMITRSLCPRISWACCASCTLMVLSSLKIEPLGREHSNITSWSENTFRPNSQSTPKKLSFWDLCRANGEIEASKYSVSADAEGLCPPSLGPPDCRGGRCRLCGQRHPAPHYGKTLC